MTRPAATTQDIESPYAWLRLAVSLLLMTIGGSGMYAVTVVLPRIQEDFGVARADASLPYTLTMIGFGLGGILMGRMADRFGVLVPVGLGAVGLGAGFIAAGLAPQVHIVADCGDLGFGAARGAEMLSLMLGLGVVSRLVSGWISDRIGGLRTLLLGSILQGVALLLFLPFQGLLSLYVVAGLFGLFQGGIVPAYALIVRQHFSPREAGARGGTVLMATLFGMALGGWMSGAVFDLTGSYRAAFINGIAWNLLNVAIVGFLLYRASRLRRAGAMA